MREKQLFLNLLAAEVYNAKVGGLPLRDATDFKAWLIMCSRVAGASKDEQEFFEALRN